MEKIGIFGGSFNPPHVAHGIASVLALESFGLDKLYIIPAAIPPHKRHLELADGSHRLEMCRLTFRDERAEISEIELQREGPSYTIDTLRELHAAHPEGELILFIGADNLDIFRTWKDHDAIMKLAKVVALGRPGFGADESGNTEVATLTIPLLEIASSEIRDRVKSGKCIRFFVTDAVESYILEHNLYRD